MREAMSAFANSAIPDKPGIIYVGVKDNGEIVGGDNLDSWQRKISSWAASCFPPINVIQTWQAYAIWSSRGLSNRGSGGPIADIWNKLN